MRYRPAMSESNQPDESSARSAPCRAEPLDWPVTCRVGPGLDGAIATETRVSCVDGETASLRYRGVPIEDLAGSVTFEEAAGLLIEDIRLSSPEETKREWRDRVRASRELPPEVEAIVRSLPSDTHPTRLLRAGVSALGCFELAPGDDLAGSQQWSDDRIVGQITALAAAVARHRRGQSPKRTDPTHSLAEGLLTAIQDQTPSSDAVDTLDLCLVVCADQGMDAPTFTSMIVGSCEADPYYNVVAGLSALSGPRVGGAAEAILDAITAVDDEDDARRWVRQALSNGHPIPGFGHRVYRSIDPRVAILRERAHTFATHAYAPRVSEADPTATSGVSGEALLQIARAVEDEATQQLAPKGIHANVNIYASVLFHMLGAEPELVPCLIAAGRVAGLVARVREYLGQNRIFRPVSHYVGPAERPFTPPEER